MATKAKKASLDDLIQNLNLIVNELESGNLDLESSMKKYEEGIKIYRKSFELIKDAELQIEYLNKNLDEDRMGNDDI